MSSLQESFFRLKHPDKTSPDPFRQEALPMQTLPPQIFPIRKSQQTHEDTLSGNKRITIENKFVLSINTNLVAIDRFIDLDAENVII